MQDQNVFLLLATVLVALCCLGPLTVVLGILFYKGMPQQWFNQYKGIPQHLFNQYKGMPQQWFNKGRKALAGRIDPDNGHPPTQQEEPDDVEEIDQAVTGLQDIQPTQPVVDVQPADEKSDDPVEMLDLEHVRPAERALILSALEDAGIKTVGELKSRLEAGSIPKIGDSRKQILLKAIEDSQTSHQLNRELALQLMQAGMDPQLATEMASAGLSLDELLASHKKLEQLFTAVTKKNKDKVIGIMMKVQEAPAEDEEDQPETTPVEAAEDSKAVEQAAKKQEEKAKEAKEEAKEMVKKDQGFSHWFWRIFFVSTGVVSIVLIILHYLLEEGADFKEGALPLGVGLGAIAVIRLLVWFFNRFNWRGCLALLLVPIAIGIGALVMVAISPMLQGSGTAPVAQPYNATQRAEELQMATQNAYLQATVSALVAPQITPTVPPGLPESGSLASEPTPITSAPTLAPTEARLDTLVLLIGDERYQLHDGDREVIEYDSSLEITIDPDFAWGGTFYNVAGADEATPARRFTHQGEDETYQITVFPSGDQSRSLEVTIRLVPLSE